MNPRLASSEERQRFEAFVGALFETVSESEMRQHLADLAVPRPYRLRMKVMYSKADWHEVLARLHVPNGSLQRHERGVGYKYTARVGRGHRRAVNLSFALLPTSVDSTRVLVTVCTSSQWAVLLALVAHAYPRLVPVFLSQRELIAGTLRLGAESDRYVLRVAGLSAREPLSASWKRRKAVREWTDEELRDVLRHVADRRQVLESIELAFFKRLGSETDVVPSVLAKMTKRGEVEVTGSFDLAMSSAVAYVAEVGGRKLALYSRRGLRDRQYRAAPLEIRFSGPVLAEVSEVRKLVAVLAKYPHAMYSVDHGNPYAHVQVSDNYDGSAFDVWAVSGESILLVPLLKASEAAVERLVHYVFERFREGEVRDYAHA